MKRRKIASLVIAATCIAGLSACDRHAPDVSISLAVRNNADGTTTVSGTAADRDQPAAPLLVQVSVGDDVVATVAANEDRPGWRFQYPDSFCVSFGSNTCMIEVKGAGTKHGFSATFPTPTDTELPVCVWTHGVAQLIEDPSSTDPNEATESTTVCAKAKEVETLTGSTSTSTSSTPATAPPTPVPPTTAAPTTSAAPTTTTEATTTTTSTTMPAPTSTTSTTIFDPGPGPGGPCSPDPMDLSCI